MLTLTRLAVGLEPPSVPDAAGTVSPNPFPEFWVPRWSVRRTIKQTKNCPSVDTRLLQVKLPPQNLTSGDGTPALKWGSTGAWGKDERDGNPVYDWRIVDRIFKYVSEPGVRPYAEIGFMPRELGSSDALPAQLAARRRGKSLHRLGLSKFGFRSGGPSSSSNR